MDYHITQRPKNIFVYSVTIIGLKIKTNINVIYVFPLGDMF